MPKSPVLLGSVLVAVAFVAAAFAFGRAAAGTRVVTVTERDFRIAVSTHRVAAGTVVFRIDNDGPDAHELIVVRATHGLPLRADGITVDEDKLTKRTVGALEPADPGDVRELRVQLRPGRYVLLCNMDGHYMGGMHTDVIAR